MLLIEKWKIDCENEHEEALVFLIQRDLRKAIFDDLEKTLNTEGTLTDFEIRNKLKQKWCEK